MVSLNKALAVICLAIILIQNPVSVTGYQSNTQGLIHANWSPDGAILALVFDRDLSITTSNDQELWLYSSEGQPISSLSVEANEKLREIVFSPDSSILATITYDSLGIERVRLWDISNPNAPISIVTLQIEHEVASDAAFSPDSSQLALNHYGEVRIWDINSGQLVTTLDTGDEYNGIKRLSWNSTNNRLAVTNGQQVYIWDMSTQGFPLVQQVLAERVPLIEDITWKPDGTSLVFGDDEDIQVWQWDSGLQQFVLDRVLDQNGDLINRIEWQGSRLASTVLDSQLDNRAIVWDTQQWEVVANIDAHNEGMTVWALALSPDGSRIAYTQPSGELAIKTFPTANAGPDQTHTDTDANGTEPVTLDATGNTDSDGSIVSYDWQLDGTSIATGPSPQVELPVGEHVITLRVTDNDGLINTDEVVITIEGTPSPASSARIAY